MPSHVPPISTYSHEAAEQRGTHSCVGCGYSMPIELMDAMPKCPNCGESEFRLGSMFAATTVVERNDLNDDGLPSAPDWLEKARKLLPPDNGVRIAYRDGESLHVLPLTGDCSRIGRSAVAEIRLEDPTVSRRHALLSVESDGLRVYDDRSLNGVYVNGEPVEEALLSDGDELVVGRFHIFVIEP